MFPQCEGFFVTTHMVFLLQIFISYIEKCVWINLTACPNNKLLCFHSQQIVIEKENYAIYILTFKDTLRYELLSDGTAESIRALMYFTIDPNTGLVYVARTLMDDPTRAVLYKVCYRKLVFNFHW